MSQDGTFGGRRSEPVPRPLFRKSFVSDRRWEGPDLTQLANSGRGDFRLPTSFGTCVRKGALPGLWLARHSGATLGLNGDRHHGSCQIYRVFDKSPRQHMCPANAPRLLRSSHAQSRPASWSFPKSSSIFSQSVPCGARAESAQTAVEPHRAEVPRIW